MKRVRAIYRLLKAFLNLYTLDPIDVTYDEHLEEIYPVVSKSGCSSVKLSLIRRYVAGYDSQFPAIHQLDLGSVTKGNLSRHIFLNYEDYVAFCRNRSLVLVIRNPASRLVSCYGDMVSGKNTMYQYPSKLHELFKFQKTIKLSRFLKIVRYIPDRLADRHFRSQSYYLHPSVIEKAKSVKVLSLSQFMAELPPPQRTHLNRAKAKQDESTPLSITRSESFRKRYGEDIELYGRLNKGSLTLK